jgi:hypothetical protein
MPSPFTPLSSLFRPYRILAVVAAGLGFWQCEPFEPSQPPFHRHGIDTVWGTQDTVIQTNLTGTPTDDTLWKVQSITTQSDPGGNLELDSTVYAYDILHFQVRNLSISRTTRQTGSICKTDSGVVGNTNPPVRSECVETTRPLASPMVTFGVDTLWMDTTSHVFKVGLDLGPRLGPLPTADTLRATLIFPEQKLPPFAIHNSSQSRVSLSSGSWAGLSAFNTTFDTLFLTWPAASATTPPEWENLGGIRGVLTTQTSQKSASRNYSFQRVFRGLVPAGAAWETWWRVQHGTMDVPVATAFTSYDDHQRFAMAVDPKGKDSLLHLRSRFRLRGDFSATVRMVLPPQSDSGCLLSWLFAPAEEEPFILYEKAVKTTPARFTLLSSAAGFFVNTTGKLNPPITIVRTGASETSTWKGSFPKEAILNADRRNNEVTVRVCNLNQDTCTALVSRIAPGDPALPQDLQLQWTVGGFGKQAFQVLWSDFTIREGKLVLP